MLVSGQQKLDRMRDGRAVYLGAERVDDVTAHPAFREGAKTVAGLYDLKADPAQRDLFSFEENGERISLYWLRCRTRDDLVRRMRCCKAIADAPTAPRDAVSIPTDDLTNVRRFMRSPRSQKIIFAANWI